MELTRESLARMIDHTELKSHSGEKKIRNLCSEAKTFSFYCVCVNPIYVPLSSEQLQGSDVLVCSVVGFPLGNTHSRMKAREAQQAVAEGAREIDMVIHVGALKDQKYDRVKDDIRAVVEASQPHPVKVILETCYLTDDEIVRGCELSVEAGAKFVKTSTGFGAFGAFEDHVQLMRKTVGPDIGVKASGGIMNFKDAWRLIQAGADRLGTSAGVAILEGYTLHKFAPTAWLLPEIPCHNCPSRHAKLDKLPKGLYTYYKKRCLTCEHQETYNRFYD